VLILCCSRLDEGWHPRGDGLDQIETAPLPEHFADFAALAATAASAIRS